MDDVAAQLNQANAGNFASEVGLVITVATKDRVVGTVEIEARHLQPAGIVHGGVYCTVVESLASMGAFLNVADQGRMVAGIENHTSFLRSIGSGRVTGVAVPVNLGRTTHLWDVELRDDRERLVAKGSVRMAVLEPRPSP
jgi:uncharacterized protein (TIGR00369 family)